MTARPAVSVTVKSRALAGGRVRWMLYFRPAAPNGKTLERLDQFSSPADRPAVEKIAAEYRKLYTRAGAPRRAETADEWYDRFVRSRMGKVSTATADHQQWLKWISPTLGSRLMTAITPDDVEAVRDVLDRALDAWEAAGKKRGTGLAFHTAANVWAILTLAMKHASTRKGDRAFRVREAAGLPNPCDGVRPPRRGAAKRRHWLRPVEVSALLALPSLALEWREAIAIGLYLHLRPGELHELRARDVDLDAGEVHITRAWAGGSAKAPKTYEGIRTVSIPATLAPLLARLVDGASPNALLCPIVGKTSEHDRPELFRAALRAAGVLRSEIFEDTPTHEPVDFRTIRDTGITWRFLAGDRAEVVQREAGHVKLTTTLGYAKEVENRGGRFGVPFPALPFAPAVPQPCEPYVNGLTESPKKQGELVARVGFEPTTFGL